MKQIYFIFGIIALMGILLISGCAITPENADVVAKSIQEKYDDINSYKATIHTTTSEGYSKTVLREVKRPDKYKDLEYESEGNPYNTFQICNVDTAWLYVDGSDEIRKTADQDCSEVVTAYFSIFDKIKGIFDYKYVITEEQLNEEDALKAVLTTQYNVTYALWFSKGNYQLIQGIVSDQDRIQTTIYDDLQLNIELPDSEFEPVIPSGVKVCEPDISKVRDLLQQLESIIGAEDNKKGILSKEEFEQSEEIRKQVQEANCEKYTMRTYEQYLGSAKAPEQKTEQTQEILVNTTLDYKFELKIGETAFIESNKTNDTIKINFLDVTEDSRCPSDNYVACAWEGQATIIVNILKNDQNLGNFSLTSRAAHEDLAVKAFDGYSIKLLEVNPAQRVAQKIELSDYVIMLVVSKV